MVFAKPIHSPAVFGNEGTGLGYHQALAQLGGLIGRDPAESFRIGHEDKMLVDQEAATTPFTGKLINLKVE